MPSPLCIRPNLVVRLTGSPWRAPNAAAVGLEGAPAKDSAPITLVDVETPLIISARSASTVAKLIIKLSDNQKKSRTKQSRNFPDQLTSQIADMSHCQRRVTRNDWPREMRGIPDFFPNW